MVIRIVWMRETDPDWQSKAIMWFEGAPYSHVAILYQGKIVHAITKGVCIQNAEDYAGHAIVLEKEVALDCPEVRFWDFVEGESGKEYSKTQLFMIAASKFLKTEILMDLFGNGATKRVCSEFVGAVLWRFSEFKLPGHPDFWTPVDLAMMLKPDKVG